jgi:hypothetical protein
MAISKFNYLFSSGGQANSFQLLAILNKASMDLLVKALCRHLF